ncbi:MAG: acyltransferase [Acidobacteriota bacterium]|nr:acyltransferase [Acidobacteriota bacterium]
MKQHQYVLLDGLRGMAALFILFRHVPFAHIPASRSYLAVDLFFILSGFVIAFAYDEKVRNGSLSPRKFLLVRWIRLYPVYFLSVILGTILIFGMAAAHHQLNVYTSLLLGAAAITSLLYLPFPLPGSPSLFPLNGPYWSLFYELVMNMLYARFRSWLTNRTLATMVALSGILLAITSVTANGLDVGSSWSILDFASGILRSCFGISTGLLLYRIKNRPEILPAWFSHISPWAGFPLTAAILLSPPTMHYNGAIDAACACLVFPFCVLAGSNLADTRAKPLMLLLGSASYPVYVLHYPLSMAVVHWCHAADRYAPYSAILFAIVLVFASQQLEKYYDIPIRRWASQRLLGSTR